MVTVAVFFFRVPLTGSVPLLYASMTVYLLAVLGVGLFISSLANDTAAGDPGHVLVHGADDAVIGLRQPRREHAGLAAIS